VSKRRIDHVNRASPPAPAGDAITEQVILFELSQPSAFRVFARLAKLVKRLYFLHRSQINFRTPQKIDNGNM
ncbi:uncharacterized protein METZ01_LOCUS390818, partial [marine metagenome]|jgi:hypothetical protein